MSRPVSIMFSLVAACFCLFFFSTASAQPWPAAIRSIEKQGVTIVKQFEAPGGMTGFAARAGARPLALYLTPDGEHVIVGTLLDAEGKNLSKPVLDAMVTTPDRENTWPKLERASWIGDGDDDAPRILYVFTDPNCPFCHKFYDKARPWVKAGKVELRHLPVGILKPTSPAKSAALLAADDPEAALRSHEKNYRSGGIEPLEQIPANIDAAVSHNNRLMSDMGIEGTPGIVWKDAAGQVQVKVGLPTGASLDRVMGPR